MINMLLYFVLHLGERLQTRPFYLGFCVACSAVALAFGLLVTQSGTGISPDAIDYITAGKSIYNGEGFQSIWGSPYVRQGPIYPLSIAAFMHLGFDAAQAARLIPILCFALLMFPLFFLGKKMGGFVTGYITCIVCLVFSPLLWLTSYAWTEMLYILLSVAAVFFLVKYSEVKQPQYKLLVVAGFLTALLILTRYIGVTLLAAGLIMIIIKNRSQLSKLVRQGALFALISGLPVVPWLYRNFSVGSNLMGRDFSESSNGLLDNMNSTVTTIADHFTADPFSDRVLEYSQSGSYIILAVAVACLVLVGLLARINSTDGKPLRRWLLNSYVPILCILIYFAVLIVMGSRFRLGITLSERHAIPTYPFLIVLGVSFIYYAYRQIRKPSSRLGFLVIAAILFTAFIGFHADESLDFYRVARNGQGYNSTFWRNHEGIAWVDSNVPDDTKVYSNRSYAIAFLLDRPYNPVPHSSDEAGIAEFFGNLNNENDSFVVGFKVEPYAPAPLLTNMEIEELNREYEVLDLVDDFDRFTVWRVRE